jgi:hypothetical protein
MKHAIEQFAHQCIFDIALGTGGCALDDGIAPLERMHRKSGEILHATAGMGIVSILPDVVGLLGVDSSALIQSKELEAHVVAEQQLRVGRDWPCQIDAAGKRKRTKRRGWRKR